MAVAALADWTSCSRWNQRDAREKPWEFSVSMNAQATRGECPAVWPTENVSALQATPVMAVKTAWKNAKDQFSI